MEAKFGWLYSELRQTRKELMEKLLKKDCSPLIEPLIKEELEDINLAIEKLKCGEFGKCEMSGEFLPENLLNMIPTLKSMDDYQKLNQYFCKPIY